MRPCSGLVFGEPHDVQERDAPLGLPGEVEGEPPGSQRNVSLPATSTASEVYRYAAIRCW